MAKKKRLSTESRNTDADAKKLAKLYPAVFAGLDQPTSLWSDQTFGKHKYEHRGGEYKGIKHLPGVGSSTAEVMFVGTCVLNEELYSKSSKAKMLKGPAANLFIRCLARVGIEKDDYFYTTLVKYPVPRLRPKASDIRWCAKILDDEIATIKPKLIVCLGSHSMKHLLRMQLALKDVQGGLFRSEAYNCLIYPMDTILNPLQRPEYLERFIVDLKEVKRTLDEIRGVGIVKIATDYHTIDTLPKLQSLMLDFRCKMDADKLSVMAIDAEWHGQTAFSGQLRSVQFSWKPGSAAYVRLMDDKLNQVLPLEEARNIMKPVLNDTRLKFIGHNFAADAMWLEEHLQIDTYQRCVFDTMFAQHTLNEYADLKLERLAVRYTDLGRYDIPLTLWKKTSKFGETAGYGSVPDSVLIPYAEFDVDTTMRCYPILYKQLVQQGLLRYYSSVALPFVTDGFVHMMRVGLPIDVQYLDELRETFARNQAMLSDHFVRDIVKEADVLLMKALMKVTPDAELNRQKFLELYNMVPDDAGIDSSAGQRALLKCKEFVGVENAAWIIPIFRHWCNAYKFNVNSAVDVKQWLFDAKGLTPLKTTKRDSMQMAWERVLALPLAKQVEYSPAVDKSTIKLLAQKDKLVARLEELKGVGNIVRSFLKAKEGDDEHGLHKWIQPDMRIHANFSLTETARPRCVHGDTVIRCSGGDKRIEDIRPGDEVWTHNNRWRRVTDHYVFPPEPMFEVSFSNGQVLKATLNHRLLMQDGNWISIGYVWLHGEWLPVFRASDNDVRTQHAASALQIHQRGISITKISSCGSHLVYDISVDIDNSYAACGCYSHNSWSPNVLNWPKAVTKPIERAFAQINKQMARDKFYEIRGLGFSTAEVRKQVQDQIKKPVSLRSAVKAPDGYALVDMDLATAEVVALAYISGDADMIKVLTEPDTQFARIDVNNPKKAVRIAYNGNEGIPESEWDPALIVALDDPRILRKDDGSIVHPKRDLHYEFATSVAGKPREKLDENVWRSGVGKVGNFCLAEFEIVITDQGLVPIQDVKLSHLLWDGVEWVTHDGVVCNGEQEVHFYQGLWATDNHEVWITDGRKITFGEARIEKSDLARGGQESAHWNEIQEASTSRRCKVYDILNAGPRHRFTCSGVLVSNSIPYGAAAPLLERMVEVNSGIKPPEGTGDKMIDSYKHRYPSANRFLEQMEYIVESPGVYRSVSGRVRHFFYDILEDVDGLTDFAKKGILSPLTRQARNFPMQELVAATTAKALIRFMEERRKLGIEAQVMMLLYDAMTVVAPLEQLKVTIELLRNCLTVWTPWTIKGRTFNFDVDPSISIRWGVKPTKAEKAVFAKHME